MTILGVDPGIARTGWGVVEVQSATLRLRSGQEFKIQNYGCIESSPSLSIEKRLQKLHLELTKIIKREKPEVLVIEEIFFNTNAKTAFIVGQARGVVMLCAAQNSMQLAIYTPLQVKVAVSGYGRAEKQQVGKMVKILLKLSEVPKPDDVADALALCLTHAFSRKMKETTSS